MAEFMRVPERLLIPLDGLDPVDAAPLTDAGLTPYHAIKRSLPLLVPGRPRWSSAPAGSAISRSRSCGR